MPNLLYAKKCREKTTLFRALFYSLFHCVVYNGIRNWAMGWEREREIVQKEIGLEYNKQLEVLLSMTVFYGSGMGAAWALFSINDDDVLLVIPKFCYFLYTFHFWHSLAWIRRIFITNILGITLFLPSWNHYWSNLWILILCAYFPKAEWMNCNF